jgi:hypothetical protein
LKERNWSEGVVRQAVWLSGVTSSFEMVEEVLREIGGVTMSASSIWRRVEKWGERIRAIEDVEREKANTLPDRGEIDRPEVGEGSRMGLSMDGTMINIREEGWKELKVGSVFDIALRSGVDEVTKEEVELPFADNISYVAHLGGPDIFGQKVWAEARQRYWNLAPDTVVVGDGATWIWNLTREHFFESYQVVDWYHACEHLASAARLMHGEGSPAAQRWYKRHQTILFQGHAEKIAKTLNRAAETRPKVAKELRTEAGYFDNNKRRMQYLEMRAEGYPIGSGTVESGGKQFKARLAGPGMRWSRAGAERLIPIRAAVMSGRFDSIWRVAYNSPPN